MQKKTPAEIEKAKRTLIRLKHSLAADVAELERREAKAAQLDATARGD